MKAHESGNPSDYLYYPIAFTSRALVTVLTMESSKFGDAGTWITPVDKEKIIIGTGANELGDTSILFDTIAVGY